MQYNKPALTTQNILDLLVSRWLYFEDIEWSRKYFDHIWYFRMTGYLKYFQDLSTDQFFEWICFNDVLDLYIFDRKLRLLTLDAIEKIEVSFKSNVSNYMCKKYGIFWYTDRSLFKLATQKDNEIYDRVTWNIQIAVWRSSAPFVKEYLHKYENEHLPSWMLMEELTLWDVSNLYNLLNESDAKEISKVYNTYFVDLRRWMHLCTTLRNISAHHWRLRNRKYVTRLRSKDVTFKNRYQFTVSNNNANEVIPNFFNSSLVLNYLLKKISPDSTWLHRLEELFVLYSNTKIESMWFQANWKESFG